MRSGWRFAPCVACPSAVSCGGAAVASGESAVVGCIGSVVRGLLAPGAGDLGLIWLYRVADRSVDVAFPGCPVAGFRCAVSDAGLLIEAVEVACRIGPVALVAGGHRPSVTVHGKVAAGDCERHGVREPLAAARPGPGAANGEH